MKNSLGLSPKDCTHQVPTLKGAIFISEFSAGNRFPKYLNDSFMYFEFADDGTVRVVGRDV